MNIWATEAELNTTQYSIPNLTRESSCQSYIRSSEPCTSSLTVVGGVTYQRHLCQHTGEIAVFVADSGTLFAARRRRSTGTLCCRCSASLLLLAVSFSFPPRLLSYYFDGIIELLCCHLQIYYFTRSCFGYSVTTEIQKAATLVDCNTPLVVAACTEKIFRG